jgi:peroxiredoxin
MFDRRPAPALEAIEWYNSPPLSMSQLRGKVVMIDFWTYSCINCLRTLPHMRRVWSTFKDHPFVMIGVHSPEFDFEKEPENLMKAIKRHRLEYPIAVDNDMATWTAFENRYWPAQYFIDKDGMIRHIHAGEGGELEIEAWIVRLLKEMGVEVELAEVRETSKEFDPRTTHETYAGALRNKGIGNDVDCEALKVCQYNDEMKHEPGVIYLHGQWYHDTQFLQYAGSGLGHVLLRYRAKEVYAVMSSDEVIEVEVRMDDRPLLPEEAGQDIYFHDNRSWLRIDRNDMFYIIRSKDFGEHELKIITDRDRFHIYAYTFG